MLMGVNTFFPHGFADPYRKERTIQLRKSQNPRKSCKSWEGEFNAELGLCIGLERLSVGPHTFKGSNIRGDWLKQWLMLQKLETLKTMYKKTPQKELIERNERKERNERNERKDRKERKERSRSHTGLQKVQRSSWTTSW